MSGTALAQPAASFLARRDPRFKLIALLVLAFGFSLVSHLASLMPMVLATVAIIALSGLSPYWLWKRLRLASLIVIVILVLMPFAAGGVAIWRWGMLSVSREGLEAAVLIAMRFAAIVSVATAILGTEPASRTIGAMRALGMPWIITDLALLTLRYIEEVRRDFSRMRIAARLRGFEAQNRAPAMLTHMAWLMGTLLLRSHERADRIYMAMRLRGYGHADTAAETHPPDRSDFFLLGAAIALAALLVALEVAA